ncbi:MAG TPA: hypothetical protein VD969_16555 [Symbiobacteriaceae bacterium]|nr:hypothetical protein [Symbiobacteriaceae bacterium]
MQNPIREQIKLDGRWQVRRIDAESVSVFVPGSWTEKDVILKPGVGHVAVEAAINGQPLVPENAEQGFRTDQQLSPGEWNTVRVAGDLDGARLVARNDLHITALEAVGAVKNSLSVRIRLAGEIAGPCLLSLDFSLTAADGCRVGGMEIVVGSKTRDLSVEMPLGASLTGPYRLKATLCCGERVVDNARVDIQL